MAEKIFNEFDNVFVSLYVSNNLKWYEHDGLDTWHAQKCRDFLENTDEHFKQRKIVYFDIINNNKLDEKTLRQYQTVDCKTIKTYPLQHQNNIMSSVFRNIKRKDMHVPKESVKEHFISNKQKSIGRGKFLKSCNDAMYASSWKVLYFKNMLYNSYGSIFIFFSCSKKKNEF